MMTVGDTSGMAGPDSTGEALLSIGDLAEATGVAPDTIRAWERRYGRPQAVRLPSGHRRYTSADVRWLRRVTEAMAHGHRPSKVVHLADSELDDLLVPAPTSDEHAGKIRALLALLAACDTASLRLALATDAEALGPSAFLRTRIAPLITAVGRSWADGDLGIRHEHLLTEVVEDVLRGAREALQKPESGPLLLLATLEGEQHGLGLQMVALACTAAGVRTRLLGRDVPALEILDAVRETGATGLALSVSLSTGGIRTDRLLADLRGRLPSGVRVVVGGAGARGVRRGPRGIEYVANWDDLAGWLGEFMAADSPGA